jgi:hypothetical protein
MDRRTDWKIQYIDTTMQPQKRNSAVCDNIDETGAYSVLMNISRHRKANTA